MTRRLARLALASVVASFALSARADPRPSVVRFAEQGLTITLPAGFQRQPADDPAPALLGTWRRDSDRDGPLVLQLVALRAMPPQRTPTEAELDAWRASDPVPFTDRVVAARALDLPLHALEGDAVVQGHAMVRLATVLPMADEGVRVFAGHSTSCAVSTDGRLFCWGRNLSNQLGVPRGPHEAGRPSPVEIKELKDVQSVAIGDSHTCALTKRGEVYCFGSNEHGRSGGQGSVVPPTRVNIGPAVAIAATSNASFATLKDGTLYFWGSWQRDRDFVMAPVPTPTGDRNVTLLFTNRHSAYVRSGSNDWRFPKAGVAAPMPPTGLSWAVEVSAGETHACGRDRDGALRCFGTNREGIGTGVPWNGKEPVVVPLDAPESDPLGTTAQPPPPPAACEASAASPSWQQAKPTPPTCGMCR